MFPSWKSWDWRKVDAFLNQIHCSRDFLIDEYDIFEGTKHVLSNGIRQRVEQITNAIFRQQERTWRSGWHRERIALRHLIPFQLWMRRIMNCSLMSGLRTEGSACLRWLQGQESAALWFVLWPMQSPWAQFRSVQISSRAIPAEPTASARFSPSGIGVDQAPESKLWNIRSLSL